MKLPAGKRERLQIFILGAIVAVGVIFGLFQIILKLSKSQKDTRGQISALEEKFTKANDEIEKARGIQRKSADVKAAIRKFSESYVLKAQFGNYFLNVQDFLRRLAVEEGIDDPQISEIGQLTLPARDTKTRRVFRIYSVQLSGFGGYEDVVDLIGAIETNNPYVFVSGIAISEQGGDSERHSIGFRVQWPIWENPDIVTNFVEDTSMDEDFEMEDEDMEQDADTAADDGD